MTSLSPPSLSPGNSSPNSLPSPLNLELEDFLNLSYLNDTSVEYNQIKDPYIQIQSNESEEMEGRNGFNQVNLTEYFKYVSSLSHLEGRLNGE